MNMDKTKFMISASNLNTLKDSGKFLCGVCRAGVGDNSIFCTGCKHWIHKRCSGITGILRENPDFRCQRCLGTARPIDARPLKEVRVGEDTLDVVDSFCYLGDMVCAGGGCERAIIARSRSAWGKFRELLPLLTSRSISTYRRGRLYDSVVRSVLLHGSQSWAMTKKDINRLIRTERMMIRWMLNVRLEQHVSSDTLLARLGIAPIDEVARRNRLRWFGHITRSSDWINKVTAFDVGGRAPRGRPKKTWREVIADDRRTWRMVRTDPSDRKEWRKKIGDAMKSVKPAQGEWNRRRLTG